MWSVRHSTSVTSSYTYVTADLFVFSIVFPKKKKNKKKTKKKNPVLANELTESLLKDFWERNFAADEIH